MPEPSAHSRQLIPIEAIERRIFLIRGQKVRLDADLARLYGVPTKAFNQAVKRNVDRFPEDFMFRLGWDEAQQVSRSQTVTLKRGQNPKYRPYAFTEHGVAMLSSVLRSERAVQMNILIVRAFIRLREILATHRELARKLERLERQQQEQGAQIAAVYNLVKRLLTPPKRRSHPIGFIASEK